MDNRHIMKIISEVLKMPNNVNVYIDHAEMESAEVQITQK